MSNIGNVVHELVMDFTNVWSLVADDTMEEQTVTVPGIEVGDHVNVNAPVLASGTFAAVSARVSAKATIEITLLNKSGGGVTPPATDTWQLFVFRAERPHRTNAVN